LKLSEFFLISVDLVELVGLEPTTSSLRIQGATLDRETSDDTE